MRWMAGAGILASLFLLGYGFVELHRGGPGAATLLRLGGGMLLAWPLLIALARVRGRV